MSIVTIRSSSTARLVLVKTNLGVSLRKLKLNAKGTYWVECEVSGINLRSIDFDYVSWYGKKLLYRADIPQLRSTIKLRVRQPLIKENGMTVLKEVEGRLIEFRMKYRCDWANLPRKKINPRSKSGRID